ncbi:hypothetical protein SAMD00019534_094350 [Acytostelium subglobosum LB1]|uniref:hypothetical protein n=1 Tax=Acytostelium subglobosum LB1 TaxID=1410327 RepID=UPI0006450E0D|nr:hypothetical protein SAMD00019534_094350 [Acytostelium subglobosum LB1]GAM26260.1 hypothetical protein SAMD00019534_094350 [Acytostelium subglobosum LB1]|eukprot:XP_012750814.1 hypothetical protein SAMD00019534_094350 [Acytostelium subglobosum LB1]
MLKDPLSKQPVNIKTKLDKYIIKTQPPIDAAKSQESTLQALVNKTHDLTYVFYLLMRMDITIKDGIPDKYQYFAEVVRKSLLPGYKLERPSNFEDVFFIFLLTNLDKDRLERLEPKMKNLLVDIVVYFIDQSDMDTDLNILEVLKALMSSGCNMDVLANDVCGMKNKLTFLKFYIKHFILDVDASSGVTNSERNMDILVRMTEIYSKSLANNDIKTPINQNGWKHIGDLLVVRIQNIKSIVELKRLLKLNLTFKLELWTNVLHRCFFVNYPKDYVIYLENEENYILEAIGETIYSMVPFAELNDCLLQCDKFYYMLKGNILKERSIDFIPMDNKLKILGLGPSDKLCIIYLQDQILKTTKDPATYIEFLIKYPNITYPIREDFEDEEYIGEFAKELEHRQSIDVALSKDGNQTYYHYCQHFAKDMVDVVNYDKEFGYPNCLLNLLYINRIMPDLITDVQSKTMTIPLLHRIDHLLSMSRKQPGEPSHWKAETSQFNIYKTQLLDSMKGIITHLSKEYDGTLERKIHDKLTNMYSTLIQALNALSPMFVINTNNNASNDSNDCNDYNDMIMTNDQLKTRINELSHQETFTMINQSSHQLIVHFKINHKVDANNNNINNIFDIVLRYFVQQSTMPGKKINMDHVCHCTKQLMVDIINKKVSTNVGPDLYKQLSEITNAANFDEQLTFIIHYLGQDSSKTITENDIGSIMSFIRDVISIHGYDQNHDALFAFIKSNQYLNSVIIDCDESRSRIIQMIDHYHANPNANDISDQIKKELGGMDYQQLDIFRHLPPHLLAFLDHHILNFNLASIAIQSNIALNPAMATLFDNTKQVYTILEPITSITVLTICDLCESIRNRMRSTELVNIVNMLSSVSNKIDDIRMLFQSVNMLYRLPAVGSLNYQESFGLLPNASARRTQLIHYILLGLQSITRPKQDPSSPSYIRIKPLKLCVNLYQYFMDIDDDQHPLGLLLRQVDIGTRHILAMIASISTMEAIHAPPQVKDNKEEDQPSNLINLVQRYPDLPINDILNATNQVVGSSFGNTTDQLGQIQQGYDHVNQPKYCTLVGHL